MRVGFILVILCVAILGTGFYTGTRVASFTGGVVSEAYEIRDRSDQGAGTSVQLVSVLAEDQDLLITLEVRSLVSQEHSATLAVVCSQEGYIIGEKQAAVLVPATGNQRLTLAVPVTPRAGPVTVRVMGTDAFGTFSLMGVTHPTFSVSPISTRVWWGFAGFFVALGAIFLIVRHSLTRAKVAHFARAHADGLIHLHHS